MFHWNKNDPIYLMLLLVHDWSCDISRLKVKSQILVRNFMNRLRIMTAPSFHFTTGPGLLGRSYVTVTGMMMIELRSRAESRDSI